jgi:hypothetical protein
MSLYAGCTVPETGCMGSFRRTGLTLSADGEALAHWEQVLLPLVTQKATAQFAAPVGSRDNLGGLRVFRNPKIGGDNAFESEISRIVFPLRRLQNVFSKISLRRTP